MSTGSQRQPRDEKDAELPPRAANALARGADDLKYGRVENVSSFIVRMREKVAAHDARREHATGEAPGP